MIEKKTISWMQDFKKRLKNLNFFYKSSSIYCRYRSATVLASPRHTPKRTCPCKLNHSNSSGYSGSYCVRVKSNMLGKYSHDITIIYIIIPSRRVWRTFRLLNVRRYCTYIACIRLIRKNPDEKKEFEKRQVIRFLVDNNNWRT